jgi:hypothetical protein
MTKKTTTVPATVSPLELAIAADIKANLGANKSATRSIRRVRLAIPFPLGFIKGNASAAKCGMSAAEFKLVTRYAHRIPRCLEDAGLKNFDGRWQYVTYAQRTRAYG